MFFSCTEADMFIPPNEIRTDPCAYCGADVTELDGLDCYCGAVVCGEKCFDDHLCFDADSEDP